MNLFTFIAPFYDLASGLLFRRQTNALLRHLDGVEGKTILDIGGGTGRLADMLQKRGAKVWIIDASPEMLQIAKRRLPVERINLGDAATLPYTDNCFDVAIICNALHHFPNQSGALQESHRVLRTGGILAIVEFHQQHLFSRALEHLERLLGENSRFFTPARLQTLLPAGIKHLKTVKISGCEFITMAQKV